MEKVANVMLKAFAVGVFACLLLGGFSIVGYLASLIIGGSVATELCTIIYKVYLPWVIKLTSAFVGLGLIGMYLRGQKALTVNNENINKISNRS